MAGDPSEVSIIKIDTNSYIIKDSVARTHIANSTVHVTSSDKTNWNNAATNSHTHSNKTVLDGISSANVTAWNGAYTKPTTGIPATDLASAVQTSLGLADTAVQDSSYVHTDNNFTSTLKSKLDSIAAGAEVNVQADWSTTDSASDAFIKNKPNLTTLAETAELSDAIPSTNYQTVSQAEKDSWNAKSTFSGNYSDLNGKPTIPTTLAQLATDTTHRVVTDAQINQWNNNYTLPSSGIPLNDLSQPVRDLLTNKTSLFESDIIIGDVYFKRYAAGRLMVSEVE